MYIDPHILALKSDDPSILGSTLDTHNDDESSLSHTIIRSLESSHPLIPTDTSLAADDTPSTADVHPRKQPSLISSHIGIFLSSIIGICACLIFFYWLHGCFKVGGPARPRGLTRSNPGSPRLGIMTRLRRYFSRATTEGRRRLTAKRAKQTKDRHGPCGCHWQDCENAYPVRDAGPAVELCNYGAPGGMTGLNMPPPVLGGAPIRASSYNWDPSMPRRYSNAMFYTSHVPAVGTTEPGIFSGLTMPARSFMRCGGRSIGGRPDEETYFMGQTRGCPTPLGGGLFADDGLRTPPPKYEEMYTDGSRRAF
jgi:hypothetical protein